MTRRAHLALTLRLLGGLTTEEIARAFLVPEPTVAQRIVRAKRTLGDAGVPFEMPPLAERAERLGSLLEVIYLIFNEGYAATAGDEWMRPALCEDAMRLGRMLATLMPDEPEIQAPTWSPTWCSMRCGSSGPTEAWCPASFQSRSLNPSQSSHPVSTPARR